MSWSDEPENEEEWAEWDSMFDALSSTIEFLRSQMSENSSSDLVSTVDSLTSDVTRLHEWAGVLHLPAAPVIDLGRDLDLVEPWDWRPVDEDDEDARRSRDAEIALRAVVVAASAQADVAERALCDLWREVSETGHPSSSSHVLLADEAASLAEWMYVYIEAVLGCYRTSGWLPGTEFGGGSMIEVHEFDVVQDLEAALSAGGRG